MSLRGGHQGYPIKICIIVIIYRHKFKRKVAKVFPLSLWERVGGNNWLVSMCGISVKNWLGRLLAALIIGFSLYLFLSNLDLYGIFNSDQISIPYLYYDLIQHHHVKGWTFSPTNYLFPDTLIYFLVAPLFSNFRLAVMAAYCVILISYYLLIVLVGTEACGSQSKNLFRISALISVVLINSPLRVLFVPVLAAHFGGNVLLYLLELFLIIKLWRHPSKIAYGGVILIVCLGIISDPLCQAPLVASTVVGIIGIYRRVEKSQRRLLLKTAMVLAITGLVSAFMTHLLPLLGIDFQFVSFKFAPDIHRAMFLYQALWSFAKHNLLITFILLVDVCVAGYLFFKCLVNSQQNNMTALQQYAFFILMSTASTLPILIVVAIPFDNDLIPGDVIVNHFIPAILLPVFLGFPILLSKYIKFFNVYRAADNSYLYLSLILLGYILIFNKYQSLRPFINYYPAFSQCLDDFYARGQLPSKNGVADYWDAHFHSMLTQNHLNIVTVNQGFYRYDWMSTQEDYLNQKFTYIILRKNDSYFNQREGELPQFGPSLSVLSCPQDSNYIVYTFKQGFSLKKQPHKPHHGKA
jgi:hypothetical protein